MRRTIALTTLGLLVVVALAACGDGGSGGGGTGDGGTGESGQETGIVGAWVVAAVGSGGTLAPVVDGTEPAVEFGEDGSLTGTTGCNRFNATWTGSGSDLTITPLATTKMACADEAASAQEQVIVTVLPTVTGWSATAQGIDLVDASGAPVVNLTPTTN